MTIQEMMELTTHNGIDCDARDLSQKLDTKFGGRATAIGSKVALIVETQA